MNPNLPRLKPNPFRRSPPFPSTWRSLRLRRYTKTPRRRCKFRGWASSPCPLRAIRDFTPRCGEAFESCRPARNSWRRVMNSGKRQSSASLSAPSILQQLHELGYTEPEIAEIRALIEIFSHGNMPYLLIATAARLLLEGNEIGTSRSISRPVQSRHGPAAGGKLVLMEPHHAERQLQALYNDLKSTIGLPFLNTDYRALARWPSYFDVAWRSLKPLIGTPAYDEAVERVHKKAVALVLALPNPGKLTRAMLVAAANEDTGAESVLDVVRLFQWLLPGLVVNVACMRKQTLPS